MKRLAMVVTILVTVALAWFGFFAMLHRYLGIVGGIPVSAVFATLFLPVFLIATLYGRRFVAPKELRKKKFLSLNDLQRGNSYEVLSCCQSPIVGWTDLYLLYVQCREDGEVITMTHDTPLAGIFTVGEEREYLNAAL